MQRVWPAFGDQFSLTMTRRGDEPLVIFNSRGESVAEFMDVREVELTMTRSAGPGAKPRRRYRGGSQAHRRRFWER